MGLEWYGGWKVLRIVMPWVEKFRKINQWGETYISDLRVRKTWFCYTSPGKSHHGKKKVQAVIPVAVPVCRDESDIGDSGE